MIREVKQLELQKVLTKGSWLCTWFFGFCPPSFNELPRPLTNNKTKIQNCKENITFRISVGSHKNNPDGKIRRGLWYFVRRLKDGKKLKHQSLFCETCHSNATLWATKVIWLHVPLWPVFGIFVSNLLLEGTSKNILTIFPLFWPPTYLTLVNIFTSKAY